MMSIFSCPPWQFGEISIQVLWSFFLTELSNVLFWSYGSSFYFLDTKSSQVNDFQTWRPTLYTVFSPPRKSSLCTQKFWILRRFSSSAFSSVLVLLVSYLEPTAHLTSLRRKSFLFILCSSSYSASHSEDTPFLTTMTTWHTLTHTDST